MTETSEEPPVDPGYVGELGPERTERALPSQVFLHGSIGDQRLLVLELDPDFLNEVGQTMSFFLPSRAIPNFVRAPSAPIAFFLYGDRDPGQSPATSPQELTPSRHLVWLLYPSDRSPPSEVELFIRASGAKAARASISIPKLPAPSGDLKKIYARALSRYFQEYELGSFGESARLSLARLSGARPPEATPDGLDRDPRALTQLMQLGTGYTSIELALQRFHDWNTSATFKPRVPLSSLTRPTLRQHEWKLMLEQLKRPVPQHQLATLIPAQFYLASAQSGRALFDALEQIELWGTPLAHTVEPSDFRHDLSERYQTELGLRRGPLSELLGSSFIQEFALTGSDPFFHRGTDLTLIFRTKSPTALRTGLDALLVEIESAHGPLRSRTEILEGRKIHVTESESRAVRRHLLELDGHLIVSNSLGALRALIRTIEGRAPALSNESDFHYMMARDSQETADVLIYAGDRFIEHVVSPEARIQDARRTIAWSELRHVSSASVLSGFFGEPPLTETTSLVQKGYLKKEELRHFDGQGIRWSNASASPESAWGTPRHLVPLIDLPELKQVTEDEQRAYQDFVFDYEQIWSEAIDPIALRLRFLPQKKRVEAHLRVLPNATRSEYRELLRLSGATRIDPKSPGLGLRAAFAFDANSNLKQDLESLSTSFLRETFSLQWLGDWFFLGVADRSSLAEGLRRELAPRLEESQESRFFEEDLGRLPLYVGIGLKSRGAARLFLEGLRSLSLGRDAGVLFESRPSQGESEITRVYLSGNDTNISLYYALGLKNLYLSLDEALLRDLLDRERRGEELVPVPLPTIRDASSKAAQSFSFDLSWKQRGGLATVLAWLDRESKKGRVGSRDFAALVGQGLHFTQDTPSETSTRRFFSLFGLAPVTSDGLAYRITAAGLEDPEHGNLLHPKWPALPPARSDWGRLLETIAEVRSGISFEQEAPGTQTAQTSLRVTFDLELR